MPVCYDNDVQFGQFLFCSSSTHGAPRAQTFVKVGARAPVPCVVGATVTVNVCGWVYFLQPLFLYLPHQAVHSGHLTSPLEAPEKYVRRVSHIRTKTRQLYAG